MRLLRRLRTGSKIRVAKFVSWDEAAVPQTINLLSDLFPERKVSASTNNFSFAKK
jgi:hypothetical protein